MRRHAGTGVECCLPDTHYPRPHHALDGTLWHDGLCPVCGGDGTAEGGLCPECQGGGFVLVELDDEPGEAGP
ncbi:hypothetical protein [Streptomyces sp. NPDC058045]|uniref:hypothetical protein n=1 Tax=Streptomyces sp. NPDC058045 TaxID=3346311 RepID=UPI0036EC31A5